MSSAARLPTSRFVPDFRSCFKDLRPISSFVRRPRSERRRLSSGRPPGCQPAFFRSFADPRKFRIFWRKPGFGSDGKPGFPRSLGEAVDVSERFGFVRIIKDLRPV
jgi:hypothetical protein